MDARRDFALSIEPVAEGQAIVCSGEIDMATAGRLEEAVRSVVGERPPTLRLDLRPVTFCGSEGVGLLVRAQRLCDEKDIKLVVTVNPTVDRVLEISGVKDHLTIE